LPNNGQSWSNGNLVREIPDPIQWHEGMLLMPQHFQQMSGRYENLAQFTATLSGAFPWGLIRFDYDQSAFVSGTLRILRVEAVMPDGFLVTGGTELGADLELNLKNHASEMCREPVMIHLIVPAQTSMTTSGDLARYSSRDGQPVPDETTGEDPVHIPRLRPRLALWAGALPPARYQSLPLMRVMAQNDAFQQTPFLAPVLAVREDSELGGLCAGTLGLVRAKSYVLAEQFRASTLKAGEQESADLRVKLQSLVPGLPGPEAALQSGRAHPFTLYLLMCQLAGHVAGVTPGLVPPWFSPYRHEDLMGTFEPVLSFIEEAVAEAVVDAWEMVPFRMVNGAFEAEPVAALTEAITAGPASGEPNVAMALRPAPGVPEETVNRWARDAVIGSSSAMPNLLMTRVSGAARRRADQLPGLVPPRGTVLFALSLDPSAMRPGEALQIVERYSSDGRPVDAMLYIRRSTETRTGA
jgi:type VI secretion system protein ImpJ